jgi:NNP family nitrate/nitrite transporter-like MFS transporter
MRVRTGPDGRALELRLRDVSSVPMRTFHVAWVSFFACFVGWFALAPLMPQVRRELGLTGEQVADLAIASVAGTVLARLAVGWLCDRVGPRRTYAVLLAVGALPVAAVGLVQSYQQLLVVRFAVGMVGASFVITTYHVSRMFSAGCVGAATATAAGWGNLGGGVANMILPAIAGGLGAAGLGAAGWRVAMVVPALLMLLCALAYLAWTRDTPGAAPPPRRGAIRSAARDGRAWALALAYGCCFGVELTVNGLAAVYFVDTFGVGLATAGLLAGLHGGTNLFARGLGGWCGDRLGGRFGLGGRTGLLAGLLFAEGALLVVFSQTRSLELAVPVFVAFSVCVAMSAGATYAIVPFVRPDATGSVSGIVGAGGNLGAVAAGFLFRSAGLGTSAAFLYLGAAIMVAAPVALAVRFSRAEERRVGRELATSRSVAVRTAAG